MYIYIYIIRNLFTFLLMIIKGFINPFNGGQSLLAYFPVLLPLNMFWYHGHLIVKHGTIESMTFIRFA